MSISKSKVRRFTDLLAVKVDVVLVVHLTRVHTLPHLSVGLAHCIVLLLLHILPLLIHHALLLTLEPLLLLLLALKPLLLLLVREPLLHSCVNNQARQMFICS